MLQPITDDNEIKTRIAKFKSRAKHFREDAHIRLILDSFPKERRLEIFNEVQSAAPDGCWLKTKAKFPYEPE